MRWSRGDGRRFRRNCSRMRWCFAANVARPANGLPLGATGCRATSRQYMRGARPRRHSHNDPFSEFGSSIASRENKARVVPGLGRGAPTRKRAAAVDPPRRHSRDGILAGRLRTNGPDDVGLVALDVTSAHADWSGVEQHSDEIGRAAADMLFSKLHAEERGVPALPRLLRVHAHWREKRTFRRWQANLPRGASIGTSVSATIADCSLCTTPGRSATLIRAGPGAGSLVECRRGARVRARRDHSTPCPQYRRHAKIRCELRSTAWARRPLRLRSSTWTVC